MSGRSGEAGVSNVRVSVNTSTNTNTNTTRANKRHDRSGTGIATATGTRPRSNRIRRGTGRGSSRRRRSNHKKTNGRRRSSKNRRHRRRTATLGTFKYNNKHDDQRNIGQRQSDGDLLDNVYDKRVKLRNSKSSDNRNNYNNNNNTNGGNHDDENDISTDSQSLNSGLPFEEMDTTRIGSPTPGIEDGPGAITPAPNTSLIATANNVHIPNNTANTVDTANTGKLSLSTAVTAAPSTANSTVVSTAASPLPITMVNTRSNSIAGAQSNRSRNNSGNHNGCQRKINDDAIGLLGVLGLQSVSAMRTHGWGGSVSVGGSSNRSKSESPANSNINLLINLKNGTTITSIPHVPSKAGNVCAVHGINRTNIGNVSNVSLVSIDTDRNVIVPNISIPPNNNTNNNNKNSDNIDRLKSPESIAIVDGNGNGNKQIQKDNTPSISDDVRSSSCVYVDTQTNRVSTPLVDNGNTNNVGNKTTISKKLEFISNPNMENNKNSKNGESCINGNKNNKISSKIDGEKNDKNDSNNIIIESDDTLTEHERKQSEILLAGVRRDIDETRKHIQFINLMCRTSVLVFITATSSIISLICFIIRFYLFDSIHSNNYNNTMCLLFYIHSIIIMQECYLNSLCVFMNFNFGNHSYRYWCRLCDQGFKDCCILCFFPSVEKSVGFAKQVRIRRSSSVINIDDTDKINNSNDNDNKIKTKSNNDDHNNLRASLKYNSPTTTPNDVAIAEDLVTTTR